jgi:hypothetical protein
VLRETAGIPDDEIGSFEVSLLHTSLANTIPPLFSSWRTLEPGQKYGGEKAPQSSN